jgi:hypothetical protein
MTEDKFHIVTIALKRLWGMFHELAETLLYGLRALNFEASMATNQFSETSTNIVLDAGLISESMTKVIPQGSIFYNTEQIDSKEVWINRIYFRNLLETLKPGTIASATLTAYLHRE